MKTNMNLIAKTSVLCAFVLALAAGTPGIASAKQNNVPKGHAYGHDKDRGDGRYGVPEIDPNAATFAIGLAGGALAILRDRRRQR